MAMTSSVSYLLRGLHEWILDNSCTPYLVIDAAVDAVMFYVETNKIPRKTMEVRAVTSLTGSPDEINFLTNFFTKKFSYWSKFSASRGYQNIVCY